MQIVRTPPPTEDRMEILPDFDTQRMRLPELLSCEMERTKISYQYNAV